MVVAPPTLTEAILSQPLLALVRRLDPGGRLDVLTSAALAPLYHAMPEVDEVIASSLDVESMALAGRWWLSRRLAARHYDDAYLLDQARTAVIAPWLARITRRVSLVDRASVGAPRRSATAGVVYPGTLSYARLAFDAQATLPPGIPTPHIGRAPTVDAQLLNEYDIDPRAPLFIFCASSDLGPASQWPARHFAALATLIHECWPGAVVALAGEGDEREQATHIGIMAGGRIVNLAGRADLSGLMALMRHATAVIGGESRHMHLAAALRRPHVTLYGAGDPRAERVATARRKVLWMRQPCSPCLDSHCRFGHADCMTGISPHAALAALRQALEFNTHVWAPPEAASPPPPGSR